MISSAQLSSLRTMCFSSYKHQDLWTYPSKLPSSWDKVLKQARRNCDTHHQAQMMQTATKQQTHNLLDRPHKKHWHTHCSHYWIPSDIGTLTMSWSTKKNTGRPQKDLPYGINHIPSAKTRIPSRKKQPNNHQCCSSRHSSARDFAATLLDSLLYYTQDFALFSFIRTLLQAYMDRAIQIIEVDHLYM